MARRGLDEYERGALLRKGPERKRMKPLGKGGPLPTYGSKKKKTTKKKRTTGRDGNRLKKAVRNLETKFMESEREYWKKKASGKATSGLKKKRTTKKKRTAGKMGKMGKTGTMAKGRPTAGSRGTTKRGTQSTQAIRKRRKRGRETTASGPRIGSKRSY